MALTWILKTLTLTPTLTVEFVLTLTLPLTLPLWHQTALIWIPTTPISVDSPRAASL